MFKKPNTVPTPDEFFDIALRDLSGAQFKCLAAIIKKTLGFNKIWDYISTSQLMEITGLSNRSVIDSTELLEQKTFIQSAYVCGHCGGIIESINKGQGGRGECSEKPSSECAYCASKEMPQKWYALSFEGEEINEYLDKIRGPRQRRTPGWGNEKSSQDKKVGSEKNSQPCEQSSLPCEKTSQDSEKISQTININQTTSQTDNQTKTFIPISNEIEREKLRYFRGVVKFFNTLKEFYPDTITQEITCPSKIKTAEEFANGKYYAISKWYEAKIPLQTICNKLEEWVRTSTAKISSTNYFKNHDVNKTIQNRVEDTTWIPKYSGAFNEAKKVGKTLLNYDGDAYDKKVVIDALNKDAARLGITVEEVVEKITAILGGNL